MKTMQALVKAKNEPGLWLQDVPVPAPGKSEVLIRILRTAICGTDVHIYNWDSWAQQTIPTPMHVGHEFVGRVAEIGENVTDFKPGDLVSGEGILCVDIAAIVWLAGDIFAQTPVVSELIVPVHMPSISLSRK